MVNNELGAVENFSTTDSEGKFVLSYTKEGEYIIEIYHTDYKERVLPVNILKVKVKVPIILVEKAVQIEEIVIKSDNTGWMKGDIQFCNLKNIINGTEEKQKEVLKKLQGVHVQNGKVKVNGDLCR